MMITNSDLLDTCIKANETNITAVCEICKKDYMALNTFYDSAKVSTCFDIKALVNIIVNSLNISY